MPFKTLPAKAAPAPGVTDDLNLEESYTANLPEPLSVAILDKGEEREGRTTAVLVFGFTYSHPASGAQIDVPSGFLTDFASIPPAAQIVFPPFGRHAKAAVLHDWLYSIGEPGRKAFADTVFKDAMTELGVDAGKREIMYEAVHLFGGGGYANAEADWPQSWANYQTGDAASPPHPRAFYWSTSWTHPPSAAFLATL